MNALATSKVADGCEDERVLCGLVFCGMPQSLLCSPKQYMAFDSNAAEDRLESAEDAAAVADAKVEIAKAALQVAEDGALHWYLTAAEAQVARQHNEALNSALAGWSTARGVATARRRTLVMACGV